VPHRGADTARRFSSSRREAALAAAVCAALQDAGFSVDQASDGEQALMRVQSRPFDLVICDLKMPRVDGKTFYGMLVAAKPAMAERGGLRDGRRGGHRRQRSSRGIRLSVAGQAVQARDLVRVARRGARDELTT
jgi:CheY-like chemotaxis protein